MRFATRISRPLGAGALIVVIALMATATACGNSTTSDPTPTVVNRITPSAGRPGAFRPDALPPGATPPPELRGTFDGTPPAGGLPGRVGFNTPIAEFLGVTEAELATALQQDGATIASVAESYGESRDQLEQFLIDDARERLAAEVGAGNITQDEAEQQITMLQDVIGRLLDTSGGPPMMSATPAQPQ